MRSRDRSRADDRSRTRLAKRVLPTLIAAVISAAYLVIAPKSEDLAAHLLRAKLFATQGFGIWNNWWYAGHNIPGYSVLFPPIAAAITPQLAGAIAATVTAALFEALAHRRFGEDAWLGASWFGVATSTSLFTGRLTFAFGLMPAVGSALALQRRRYGLAVALAFLTPLASPVGALFSALAGGAQAVAAYTKERKIKPALPGVTVVIASAVPVLALAIAFPEGGVEPFAFSAFWPIVVISIAALLVIPRGDVALRAGVVLYVIGCIAAFAIASPVGSNVTRLAPLLAGPLAALLWWPQPGRRTAALLAVVLPLLYLQWQAPVRDIRTADDNAEVTAAYFRPLIAYLSRQSDQPFRIEIPFTLFHWEAYLMAPEFPLARGWERQLDIRYNPLFYDRDLTPAKYEAWLHQVAVRYVAVSDKDLDYSAKQEVALIDHGLPYLDLVFHTRQWRVYAVRDPTPIVQGAATLTDLGSDWLEVDGLRSGTAIVRVHYSPYWAITEGDGCVGPYGDFTQLTVRRPGPIRVAMRFSLSRIRATSTRCS
ncbi:MAG TPA: hypothetical protein VMB27_10685 [Solirubrobacteraceae bacterium]|nr:hypothetical protein [Solirubrobacteraceae bacterium]